MFKEGAPKNQSAVAHEGGDTQVALLGMFNQTCGLAVAAEHLKSVISRIPVRTRSIPYTWPPSKGREDARGLNQSVNIFAGNPSHLPFLYQKLGLGFFEGRYHINTPYWETTVPPESDVHHLSAMHELWVSSEYLRDVYRHHFHGVITHVPLPIIKPSGESKMPAWMDSFHGKGYLFFCFDFLSSYSRKNPNGIIRAFKEAFREGDGPMLVIKTMNANKRRDEFNEMQEEIGERLDVLLYDGEVSRQEMHWLMANCLGYVSLHRSEGLGLTLSEAMALGRPVVATGYSGNMDFCDEHNTLLCDYRMVPVPQSREYAACGIWAEPDLGHAAHLMRELWLHRDHFHERAEVEAEKLLARRNVESCTEVVSRRLQQIMETDRHNAKCAPAAEVFQLVNDKKKSSLVRSDKQREKLLELTKSIKENAALLQQRPSWAKRLFGLRAEQKRIGAAMGRVARSLENIAK